MDVKTTPSALVHFLGEYPRLAYFAFPREVILPDGIVEIVFHYGDPAARGWPPFGERFEMGAPGKACTATAGLTSSGSVDRYPCMALVVFLRGVNVGGHRTFRPSVLAKQLSAFDVVNVGAAGTFVVRKPGARAKFRAALLRKLPFETVVALCEGRDLLRLETDTPFDADIPPDITRFVSVLSKAGRAMPSLPMALPRDGEWLVRLIGSKGRFVFGEYRRHMKTIGYLGQIDKVFGVPVTTRNWNTMLAVVRILKGHGRNGAGIAAARPDRRLRG